jgi:putative two-component system response regulator
MRRKNAWPLDRSEMNLAESTPQPRATDLWYGGFTQFAEMKILTIDDEPANVALLEALLAENGYSHVQSITDSRLALDACRQFEPDLILLDLMMPEPSGFTILQALRAENTKMFLPIIILTADANEDTKRRALRAGATDFLLKPFDHLEVALRITNLLETRRIHRLLEIARATLEDAVRARTSEVREAQTELEKVQG